MPPSVPALERSQGVCEGRLVARFRWGGAISIFRFQTNHTYVCMKSALPSLLNSLGLGAHTAGDRRVCAASSRTCDRRASFPRRERAGRRWCAGAVTYESTTSQSISRESKRSSRGIPRSTSALSCAGLVLAHSRHLRCVGACTHPDPFRVEDSRCRLDERFGDSVLPRLGRSSTAVPPATNIEFAG